MPRRVESPMTSRKNHEIIPAAMAVRRGRLALKSLLLRR
jgi:hypothetical protein